MGLLDRFKKEPGPDALTVEAVARARAVAGVASAEAVDADTVAVTWVGRPGRSVLSLTEVRAAWAKASGFDRIELMDDLISSLGPPTVEPVPEQEPAPGPADVPAAPAAPVEPPRATTADDVAWETARRRLRVVVGRPCGSAGAISWPVAEVLEARIVLGGADATPVDAQDATRWGLDGEAVRAAALDDLARTGPALDAVGPGQPAWVPTQPAEHPPAWLAAPEQLLAACGLEQAVALAPLTTELVVVDPRAHELLRSILTSTEQILATAEQVLWAAPFLVRPDGVAPWQPDPTHPCAEQVARMSGG